MSLTTFFEAQRGLEPLVALCKRVVAQRFQPFSTLTIAAFFATLPLTVAAETVPLKMGMVVMHGKGGSPTKNVAELASSLEAKGYLVSNLEMPWSGRRNYDVSVSAAEKELDAALAILRSKGAQKLFIAGHSQGGLFALYFGGRHEVDGIVAIAPGGNVDSPTFREKLAASVALARKLDTDGQGDARTMFYDFEGSKGLTAIDTTPTIYLSWFDPDGAMNQTMAVRAMNPRIPVLYIGPTGDYPALLKVKQAMFGDLPSNPLTKLFEPDSTHFNAPWASREEIVRWTTEVGAKADAQLQKAPSKVRP
jgi:pimeloyl-ACP methyl ester carboxylesterase